MAYFDLEFRKGQLLKKVPMNQPLNIYGGGGKIRC